MKGRFRNMKKNIRLLLGVLAVVAPLSLSIFFNLSSVPKKNDLAIFCSYKEFDYQELCECAEVIALVQVEDSLSKSNSVIKYNDDFQAPILVDFYGERSVKVLEYYKNTLDCGENLVIIEPAGITDDNLYLHSSDYDAMIKNNYYIVFLSSETTYGQLSLISALNGRISLSPDEDNFSDSLTNSVLSGIEPSELIDEVSEKISKKW